MTRNGSAQGAHPEDDGKAVLCENTDTHDVPGNSNAEKDRPDAPLKDAPQSRTQAPEQRMLLLLLVLSAALLMTIGFQTYCSLAQGQADLADRYRRSAHVAPDGADGKCYQCQAEVSAGHDNHHGALDGGLQYSREIIRSGANGLLMTVVNVLAGIGADIPGSGIFAMGMSNLIANAFSLGIGKFLFESARENFALSQLEQEYNEVRSSPDEEIREMVCHYRRRGLSEEDAKTVSDILSKYEDFWVRHMMVEELGLDIPREPGTPAKLSIAGSASFAGFGVVPLLGVTISIALAKYMGPQWYRPQFSTLSALGISALTLLILGGLLGRTAGSRDTLRNGFMLLTSGCMAAVCAFRLAQVCSSVGQNCLEKVRRDRHQARTRDLGRTDSTSPSAADATAPSPSDASLARSKSMSNMDAWPWFRRRFSRGLGMLWIAVSTLVVSMQLMERMMYESLRVFAYGWLTCITTGLGALPFFFIEADSVTETSLALANTVASGMMLAASAGMLQEAHEHCGRGDWQLFAGLMAGGLFIKVSQRMLGDDEEPIEALHGALVEKRHLRKAMLIFTVMFCHSAAEGIAVGVAFDRQLDAQFGLYISLLLAVHNMPEGMAVALVLVPRGVSSSLATVIATLTSVPQPLLAIAAFLFVDAFQCLLPVGLSFAAGAMVYVSLHELLLEAAEQLGRVRTLLVTSASFAMMILVQLGLDRLIKMR
mmetsp:Transcript_37883/g.67899  ORF Transcript_37883/g.67899 Transcript_37883/m.67899 type:complete len:710 (-) Transcript_37883:69-2198(-)